MTILQSVILGAAIGLSVTNFLINLGNTRRYVSLEKKVDVLMHNRLRELILDFLKTPTKTNPDSTRTVPKRTLTVPQRYLHGTSAVLARTF